MNRGRGGFGYQGGQNQNRNAFNNAQSNLDRANQFASQNAVILEIHGWNNATDQELVNFISRKTRIALTNVTTDAFTGALRGTVRDKKQADTLVQHSGIKFAGNSLKIKIIDDSGLNNVNGNGTVNSGNPTIDILKNFLRNRYDPNTKLLNLANMFQDQSLVSNSLVSSPSLSQKTFSAILKLCLKEKYVVESIDLSHNSFGDIQQSKNMVELGLTFPTLRNLSLTNNNISKIDFFEKCKNRFNNLRELVIQENPIFSSPNINPTTTLLNIIKIFPKLIVINGQKVRDEEKLNQILTFPIPKKQMFFENEMLQKAATNFISTFINMWDNSRADLLQLYTDESQFSFHFDASHILESTTQSQSTSQPASFNRSSNVTPWGNYINNSRNLSKISQLKSKMSKLSKGPVEINTAFQSLPQMKHDLMNHPENYAMEAWSFPSLGGMQIVLHGEFAETGQPTSAPNQNNNNNNSFKGGNSYARNRYNNSASSNSIGSLETRSFDRNFIVVPGPNGNFIVASDMLVVKTYGSNKAFVEVPQHLGVPPQSQPHTPQNLTPQHQAVQQQPLTALHSPQQELIQESQLPQELQMNLSPDQKVLLLRIINMTRLNFEFGYMLAQQSNWNYEAALQAFESSKAQIPPNAYL